jgi:hypothetical protein
LGYTFLYITPYIKISQFTFQIQKMKNVIIASVLMVANIFSACNSNSNKNNSSSTSNTDTAKITPVAKYTCAMHHEVISDTPGHCPKCGMEMVPLRDSRKSK